MMNAENFLLIAMFISVFPDYLSEALCSPIGQDIMYGGRQEENV